MAFEIQLHGVCTSGASSGKTLFWKFRGVINNTGGTTVNFDSVASGSGSYDIDKVVDGISGTYGLLADSTFGSLSITIRHTFVDTVRWLARVEMTTIGRG